MQGSLQVHRSVTAIHYRIDGLISLITEHILQLIDDGLQRRRQRPGSTLIGSHDHVDRQFGILLGGRRGRHIESLDDVFNGGHDFLWRTYRKRVEGWVVFDRGAEDAQKSG